MPAWALACNPLVGLHQGVEGRDWLRTSLFYTHLGDKYFAHADGLSGATALTCSAPLALVLALALYWIKRKRSANLSTAAPESGPVGAP